MTAAQPQLKTGEINDQIARILADGGPYRRTDDLEIRRLLREAESVARHDAGLASLLKADIHSLCGNWQEVLRWLTNARANQKEVLADVTEMTAAANLGYFSHSAAVYPRAVAIELGTLGHYLSSGLICGTLVALLRNSDIAEQAKLELDDGTKADLMLAANAKRVLDRLGLPEQDLTAMLDVAGEVLREHELIWSETRPRVLVVDTDEDLGLTYQFALPVPPQLAAELSDLVIERIVTRNLDKAGISFSFVSTEVH